MALLARQEKAYSRRRPLAPNRLVGEALRQSLEAAIRYRALAPRRIRSAGRRESMPGGSTAASLRQTPSNRTRRSVVPCLSARLTIATDLRGMAVTLERKLQVGLMIPIISSGKRRE